MKTQLSHDSNTASTNGLFSASTIPTLRLFRFGSEGNEKPGVITPEGRGLDVSAFGEDFTESFFTTDGIRRLNDWLNTAADYCPQVTDDVRIGSCVARPSKLIGIGVNYSKHAQESGLPIPKEPIVFMKATTCICGPFDDVIIPPGAVKTDWEAELAVVIGRKASFVGEAEALSYVAGYSVVNDYSEREYQLERGGAWDKGKSADTFGPLGPFLQLPHESLDPQNLGIWLKVNGELLQNSSTADMIFGVAQIISYVSRFMTLLPGDVIATGTPAGVGLGFKPPRFLKAGDVIELGADHLGYQKQTAVDQDSAQ